MISPHSAFAQEGCLPCWTCPNLDNDPARMNAPTAATYGAYCCDDLLIEQRVYHPDTSEHGDRKPNPTNMVPSSMEINIQPNASTYISSPQPQQPMIFQPLAPIGNINNIGNIGSTMYPLYPTNMGAPPMVNPSGRMMLEPLAPASGSAKMPAT